MGSASRCCIIKVVYLLAVASVPSGTIDNYVRAAEERRKTMHTKMNVRSVSVIGILVAMEIILARFSIHTWNIKIGFSFVPIVVAAILYGPIAG